MRVGGEKIPISSCSPLSALNPVGLQLTLHDVGGVCLSKAYPPRGLG